MIANCRSNFAGETFGEPDCGGAVITGGGTAGTGRGVVWALTGGGKGNMTGWGTIGGGKDGTHTLGWDTIGETGLDWDTNGGYWNTLGVRVNGALETDGALVTNTTPLGWGTTGT